MMVQYEEFLVVFVNYVMLTIINEAGIYIWMKIPKYEITCSCLTRNECCCH